MPSKTLLAAVAELPRRIGQRKDRNPFLAAWEAGGDLARQAHAELEAELKKHKGVIKDLAEANEWHAISTLRVIQALGLDAVAAKLRAENGKAGPTWGYATDEKPKKRAKKAAK